MPRLFWSRAGGGSPAIARVRDGALKNLSAELPGWDFDAVARSARNEWGRALGTVELKSNDREFRRTIYSALYHACLAPTLLSDVDGQYRGADQKVHLAAGFKYYTELSLWDTFRAEHPLLTLVQPGRVNDFASTMLAHYRDSGQQALPVWCNAGKETWCMIGNHSIAVLVDAYWKGFRRWDAGEALETIVATVENNREQQDVYRRQGYIATAPSGNGRWQSVTKTLEFAYNDACIARLAEALGRSNVARLYAGRAANWTNVFDAKTGFVRGRTADGGWMTPFDPKRINVDDYTEANAWQYSFFVPQNVPALIARMGGDEAFCARVEEMFDTREKLPNDWVDVSGLLGMYAHGNEPCHHVAYLYSYAGQPWRTQRRVRQVAGLFYKAAPDGLCGNDDCGQMSAWYVFSALGFYPVDPASGSYVIGSPLATDAEFHLDRGVYSGKNFRILAHNNSSTNVYVQSATLNGRPLRRSWISHEEIVRGGKLVFEMGPQPNPAWGREEPDRPGVEPLQ